jgi:hypothetical protein
MRYALKLKQQKNNVEFIQRLAILSGLVFTVFAVLLGAPVILAQEMPGPWNGSSSNTSNTSKPSKPAKQPAASQPTETQPPANSGYHIPPAPQKIHSVGDSPLTTEPPDQPVADVIKRFAEREAEFKRERGNFTYTQTFSIQTIDDDSNMPDGEYRMTSDIIFTPEGKRFEKVTYAPPDTLKRIQLSEQDLDDVRNVQPFVLTSDELPKYDLTYVGRQNVDELSCYVFDVAPKVIEKKQRYFKGRVWVDQKDLQIVLTDGKAVPDIITKNNENVFPRFKTYRENIAEGYWFPTYTKADDYLHFRSGDIHIRMAVRYSNYKRYGSTVKMGTATEVK